MTSCPICESGLSLRNKATIMELAEMIVGHHRQLAQEIYKVLEWVARTEK